METMNIPAVKLNNGIEMPVFGLGTWKMDDGKEAGDAVKVALEMGYRLIDTATLYGNERSVGEAIRTSGIPREEIFLTTKLWPTDFFTPRKAFEKSLEKLGLGYVDLYLVHWPIPLMPKGVWTALEKIYEEKLARSIGISNYGIDEIEKLLTYTHIPPTVNQVKFSPFDYEKDLLEYCNKKNIVLEAYSPLTRGTKLHDATIQDIAQKRGKTPAQVMIRWCLEHGTIVIPKSSNPERLKENADVFDWKLTPEDITALDSLTI